MSGSRNSWTHILLLIWSTLDTQAVIILHTQLHHLWAGCRFSPSPSARSVISVSHPVAHVLLHEDSDDPSGTGEAPLDHSQAGVAVLSTLYLLFGNAGVVQRSEKTSRSSE